MQGRRYGFRRRARRRNLSPLRHGAAQNLQKFRRVAAEALLRAEEQFECLAFNSSLRSLEGITSASPCQTPTNTVKQSQNTSWVQKTRDTFVHLLFMDCVQY